MSGICTTILHPIVYTVEPLEGGVVQTEGELLSWDRAAPSPLFNASVCNKKEDQSY